MGLKTRVFKIAQKKTKLPGWGGDLRQSLQDKKSCLGGEGTSLYTAVYEEVVPPVSLERRTITTYVSQHSPASNVKCPACNEKDCTP